MIFRLGSRSRRPTREQLEQEAADTIAELVAAGRPPPEVWQKAAEWRAANPPTGTSWYEAEARPGAPAPTVGRELVPRVVRLPVGATATARPGRRQPRRRVPDEAELRA